MVPIAVAANSTKERDAPPLETGILIVLLCLCGLAGNGTVIWLLGFNVRKNPYSVYIFNLAIADFLFLFCMALSSVLSRLQFGPWPWEASEVFRRIRYLVYSLGLNLLAAISTQRCLSVLFPIWYRCHRPNYLSALVCALLWGLSILENLLAIYFCVVQKVALCQKFDMVWGVLIFGVFTPMMCVSGLTLFIRVQRVSLKRQPARLYTIILVTIMVFLICALPLGVHWFILRWLHLNGKLKSILYDVAKIFSCVNSTVNPIIYYVVGSQRKRKFHEPLKVVLERALWDEETSPAEMELGSDSCGAQAGAEGVREELRRATAK